MWIDKILDKQEGTIELLPEQLLDDYNRLREEGLTIEANDLLVPVPRYRYGELIEGGKIDKQAGPEQ